MGQLGEAAVARGLPMPGLREPHGVATSSTLVRCGASESAVSVTGGPIVPDTRPLRRRWVYAMWWGVGQKTEASASA